MKHNFQYILLITYLFLYCSAIQITLTGTQTCLDYIVSQPNSLKVFYFHYNHNYDNVNMVLYYRHVKQIMQETGYGFQYKTTLQVQYQQSGTYTLCFNKKSQGTADVAFQIVDQQKISQYAGKQQLAKISKRISEFLMDIKRVGWTFKQVLEQHNKRKQIILNQQNSYGYLLILKTAVMIAIVTIQILVIKKIFK